MKTAIVNGEKIAPEAVAFELERLLRLHAERGMSADEARTRLKELEASALEQTIGAKLLIEHARKLGKDVNELIKSVCSESLDSSHEARSQVLKTFVEGLKAHATIEYTE